MAADPALRDPDLDFPRPARPVPAFLPPLGPYQRLIANPFLGVLGMVLWVAAVRASFVAKRADLFALALLSALTVPFLFHYHCLDCGATGHVARASRHHCAGVSARLQAGAGRRLRGPSPAAQTKLWLLALAVAGLYALVLR